MKTYISEMKDDTVPGMILCSHGPLAIGLMQSMEMLAGVSPNMAAFSLEPGDDVDAYRESIIAQYESYPEGTVIYVDLFGGSPCNQMMRYVQEKESVVEIVTGMNLPMILNAVLVRNNMKGNDLTLDSVQNGKEGVSRVDVERFLEDDEEDEE